MAALRPGWVTWRRIVPPGSAEHAARGERVSDNDVLSAWFLSGATHAGGLNTMAVDLRGCCYAGGPTARHAGNYQAGLLLAPADTADAAAVRRALMRAFPRSGGSSSDGGGGTGGGGDVVVIGCDRSAGLSAAWRAASMQAAAVTNWASVQSWVLRGSKDCAPVLHLPLLVSACAIDLMIIFRPAAEAANLAVMISARNGYDEEELATSPALCGRLMESEVLDWDWAERASAFPE